MNPIQAVKAAFRRTFDFRGRARRAEYWWFHALALAVACALDSASGTKVADVVFAAVFVVPGLSVTVRRLHDTDRTAWSLLIGLIPLAGTVMMLVWTASDGTVGSNRFGSSPKSVDAASYIAPPARLHRRTYLDSEGRVTGHEYFDSSGNVVRRE
jgi:uncharacterized membrane protein YhaH (DUF805 family)